MRSLLLVVALLGVLSSVATVDEEGSNYAYNMKHAKEIFDSMNKEEKPCWNFYEHACGNWSTAYENDRQKYTSVLEKINYDVSMDLIHFMEDTRLTDKPKFVQKAHDFYTSCSQEYEFDSLVYMKWLEEHEGLKWTLLTPPNDSNTKFDWVHTLATFRKYGMNGVFIQEMLYPKDEDATKTVVGISKFKQPYGFDSIAAYEIEEINKTFIYPADVKPVVEFYDEIHDFEELLTKLDELKEVEHKKKLMTAKDLLGPWYKRYLEIVLDLESLNPDHEVFISDRLYLDSLDALLKEYDDQFLSRYLEVKFLIYLRYNFKRTSDEDCIKLTRGLMPMAMHWIYEQLHPELEQEIPFVNEMFEGVLKYAKEALHSDKSGMVTPASLTKFEKMHFKLGNLPRVDSIQVLESFYSNLTLVNTDYYGNNLKLLGFYFKVYHTSTSFAEIKNINQYFNETEHYETATDVRPTYMAASNLIVVPSELLRAPIYHWGHNKFFKQSSLGTIMAYYIFSALEGKEFSTDEVTKVAGIGSFHSSYKFIFSSKPEEMKEYQAITKLMDMPLEKVFFLNAAQFYCEWLGSADTVNSYVTYLTEFSDTYDCKLNAFLKVFQ
ncbi:neprilysin-1 [Stomoxys calcitrans]|uniref:neprilysin-1 n=1 Tax=Stomoxys calcitrans TaxID=35570 RepID=UPI0027E2EDDB|nr:neprilysin-1 [Stomoxys calcitrans]